jgi:DNA-binding NtrC family response regulator
MRQSDEGFRTLVVEDSKVLREMLVHVLRDEADVLESAANGQEAVEKHTAAPFDLIVTDLNMPMLSGIELIRKVREHDDLVEFIIMTAYASLETAIEAIKAGAFDYILKPFKIEELKVAVRNVRDKVALKRNNTLLIEKLRSFYDEVDRYKCNKVMNYAEKVVKEIENLSRLRKEGLLRDEEFDDVKKRIFEKIV